MTGETTPKITALVGCQFQGCAQEVSYPLDMVQKYKGLPICQECYECNDDTVERDEWGDVKVDWHDLPPVTLSDLTA